MVKDFLGALLSLPLIVVWLPEDVAEERTGKFCRLLAPVSRSLALPSFLVTPLMSSCPPARSMPSSPLWWMEFERMRLPVLDEVMSTPSVPLKAMRLALASSYPAAAPTVLLDEPICTPSRVLPRASVPVAVVPIKLPCIVFPSLEAITRPLKLPEMRLRAAGEVPPMRLAPPPKRTTPVPVAFTSRETEG